MKKTFLSLLLIFITFLSYAQPSCTGGMTYANGNTTVVVNSGQTACIPAGSSYNGTMIVFGGGNVVVCDANFNGSLSVHGTLWDSPSTSYTGSLAVYGTRNTNASYCSTCTNPTITSSSGASRCGTGTLSIIATASSGSIRWYSASSGGTLLGTSSSGAGWTTPSISATTTYYAQAVNGSCTSASRTAVTATVTAIPTVSNSTPGERCGVGAVSLSASASSGSIRWYSAPSGGSLLGTGSPWNTPSISSSTTYYAEAINGSCASVSRAAVLATINHSPGGVSNHLKVWLKADETGGAVTSNWQDHSGNGHNYVTVSGPSLISSDPDFNYNPVIEITSGGFNAPVGSELSSEWTVFFVSKLLSSDTDGRVFEAHTGNWLWGYHGGYRNGLYMNGNPAAHNSGIATNSGVTEPHLFCYGRESTGGSILARVDGQALTTYTSTNDPAGARIDISQGVYGASAQSCDSRVGEFIIYDTKLSDADIAKVESYLCQKYGITRNAAAGGTEGDYFSNSGSTIWDASAASEYNNDVIGIGKDCSFLQKQSRSKDDSIRVFISSLATSNVANSGTITNDESFIIIGHNKGLLKSTAASNAEVPPGIITRLEREWRIKNTNFNDSYALEIEWDSAGTVDLSHLRLLVDDDGDFTNASVYGVADGLTFSFGSIIVGGIGTSIIPSGAGKFVTLGSVDAVTQLPVELSHFDYSCGQGTAHFTWETLSELNNSHFNLMGSSDGDSFELITTIQGQGTAFSTTEYQYTCHSCENEYTYYKMIQVDFDGSASIYPLVNGTCTEATDIRVFPTLMDDEVTISIAGNTNEGGFLSVRMYDNIGNLVQNLESLAYNNQTKINVSQCASGVYHLWISANGTNKTFTLVKP